MIIHAMTFPLYIWSVIQKHT